MRSYGKIFRGRLYRSRNGIFFGVCRGIADYFDFKVFWIRLAVIIGFIFTGFWPVGILYLLAAVIMKLAPVIPIDNEDDQEFYDSYSYSPKGASYRIKQRYDSIKRRIQRMEDIVTQREYDWDAKMKE
jgi:phage shock protein C